MRDGTILRGDLYRPDHGRPVPTLLQRLAYDRSVSFGTIYIAGLEPMRAVDAGLAVFVQDVRGRYTSDGDFTPFVNEATDGADTIAWLRRQTFSDGKVAMYGSSYNGATQMLAASTGPEGLVAIAPHVTADQYRDVWSHSGGATQLGFLLLWVMEALAGPDVARLPPGQARDAAERIHGELLGDVPAAFARLPTDNADVAKIAPYYRAWLQSVAPGAPWSAIDPSTKHRQMDVAGFHLGGWNDIFVDGTLRNFVGLRRDAASAWARDNQYLVVGPWSHGNPWDWQGDKWHGYASSLAALDPTAMHIEFFNAAFERRAADLPRVQLFVQGANRWIEEDEWPLKRAVATSLSLQPIDSTESESQPNRSGRLSWGDDQSEPASLHFDADPLQPVPTVGGATFLPGLLVGTNSGQKEVSSLLERPDVLWFTSEPLSAEVTVVGTVEAVIHVSSSAPDLDVVVTIVDVEPDGRSHTVVQGIQRARYRDGWDPTPIPSETVVEVSVKVGAVGHGFAPGHRIGVIIASSSFPRFDRNPHSMVDVHRASPTDMHSARHVVHMNGRHASRVILPVIA